MWNDRQVGGTGHGDHFRQLRETRCAEIRLQDVDRATIDQLTEPVTGVLALTAGDQHVAVRSYLDIAVDVFRRT